MRRVRVTIFSAESNKYEILWVCVFSLSYPAAKRKRLVILSSVALWLLNIPIQGHDIRGKKLFNIKCVFWFSLQLLSVTFLILRIVRRDIIITLHRFSCKAPVILVRFLWKLNFLDRFSKNNQISDRMKIRPVGAELFHADGQTWRS
jgi:hypothetical protein